MKKIAIVQSNYVPWLGYFQLIKSVDEFVFLDDVQYTVRDWRNRNKIKTQTGLEWLTVPVVHTSRSQTIAETTISDKEWTEKHWQKIKQNYSKAVCWQEMSPVIKALFDEVAAFSSLSAVNQLLISRICQILAIDTPLMADSEVIAEAGTYSASERLLELCLQRKADVYVSGPAAQAYLDVELFTRHGIKVEWMSYGPWTAYSQLHGDFTPAVSVLDILLALGPNASQYLNSVMREQKHAAI